MRLRAKAALQQFRTQRVELFNGQLVQYRLYRSRNVNTLFCGADGGVTTLGA
jgi:hypothetical protein